ncbi:MULTISPECIES: carbohydrate ABC transporter permease [unclassified Paenibacillus]|uniref:carbohydrate ABC transporter permease n=1 Tax=unclassified Paenibacillus TaxID=185978 RepID=UPI001C12442E|nr:MULTISPECIES: sugar ABC transporter permease [unclassified Paenibacillus]MBU5443831.1 sugar ABC transporter permease [Paenibacillus sp. MSJ-34]CAH0121466.1 Diacetylchitobiose uptake system permease protein NgcF [Paenibacillus sp. CECT 9249]
MNTKGDKSKLLILPALIVVGVVTQIPFILTIIFSFISWNVKRPDLGIKFAGIDNYKKILTDGQFYQVVLNSLLIVIVALAICTVLGILFGLMLNRNFKGVNLLRTLFVIPYFVMEAVVGIIWKTLMLNPSLGLNYYISSALGLEPIDFFGKYALLTIMILIVWQWTPFFFLIIMAGLQNMPSEIIESARIDGATGWKLLLHIQLPLIRDHINVAMTLGLINILKVFGLIYVTTSGGPGSSSSNLPYYSYKALFYDWNVGTAAAIAVVTVALTLIVVQRFYGFMIKNNTKNV